MGRLESIWAGWRSEYVERAAAESAASTAEDAADSGCVMCRLVAADPGDDDAGVVWRGHSVTVAMNAYPYTSGHVMVIPHLHVGDLEALGAEESTAVWSAAVASVQAVKAAYRPDGVNFGANLGSAAGAGIPGHVHLHVLPRWAADTNFMTSVASARVLPEALPVSLGKLRAAWPLVVPRAEPR